MRSLPHHVTRRAAEARASTSQLRFRSSSARERNRVFPFVCFPVNALRPRRRVQRARPPSSPQRLRWARPGPHEPLFASRPFPVPAWPPGQSADLPARRSGVPSDEGNRAWGVPELSPLRENREQAEARQWRPLGLRAGGEPRGWGLGGDHASPQGQAGTEGRAE
ncbi:unnamed protein product [Rangifer tarandus platyrhynchus]|uniref:Uncharacterized protein n=1 Tax=Rangifer tarandus platyrhynchus TaxID=3082113 RepID=A0AC59ZQ41_RANTA